MAISGAIYNHFSLQFDKKKIKLIYNGLKVNNNKTVLKESPAMIKYPVYWLEQLQRIKGSMKQ